MKCTTLRPDYQDNPIDPRAHSTCNIWRDLPTTTIVYDLRLSGHVTLTVYKILGLEVAILVDCLQPRGRHSTKLDACALPSGIYVYRVRNGISVKSGKMTLVR